jgi:hypothetical protein
MIAALGIGMRLFLMTKLAAERDQVQFLSVSNFRIDGLGSSGRQTWSRIQAGAMSIVARRRGLPQIDGKLRISGLSFDFATIKKDSGAHVL